ncbi:TonB-dependent siderophore receptor [uncultured Phascolarctobacterium sp.]|uniref:TonB-dependent receptor n=1 Tax=uncultured Phascolarctobacterium sp. TaxID=512296 RepID=UPI0025DC7B20|nr:TonB-dependent siderophore receptor [uncultured Phascolarctobacterium sp.]
MLKKKALVMSVLCAVASVGFVMSASAEETMSGQLDEVVIEAERGVLPGGLAKEEVTTGFTGKQDIMSAPMTVSEISNKTIEKFASPNAGIADALSLDPSVRADRGGTYTDISIRGIYQSGHSFYVNGIPGLLCQENIPYYWADSISVISGPSLGTNATSFSEAAAGSVNIQSKAATSEGNANIKVAYRGGSSMQEAIDVGRRFGENDKYGVRITASNISGDTVLDGENLSQQAFSINLDQKSDNSKTNLLIAYDHTDHKGGTGSISFGNGVTSLPSAPDSSRIYKPDWSYNEYDNWIAALNHEQKLGEHISAYLNAGYHREDWYGYIDGNPTIKNNIGDFDISMTNYPLALTKKYLGVGVKGDFNIGSVKNEYLVGADKTWYNYALSRNMNFANGGTWSGTGNIYQHNWWPSLERPSYDPVHSQDAQMTGWHIVDTLKALDDKLQVTLALHGHKASRTPVGSPTQDSDAICPTYAVSYKVSPAVTVYADHSESFGMGSLVGNTYENQGQMLDPAKTKQNEIGVKVKTGSFLNTFSAFEITQANNISVYRPGYTRPFLLQDGEQKNKGFEWAFTGNLADKWDLIGGVMYLNAEDYKGNDVNGASKWSGTVGAIYHPTEDLSFIGRVTYLDSTTINNGALDVPSYTKFDLGASYKTKLSHTPVTFDLMCYNLTGKDYWSARSGSSSLNVGAPRTIVLSANFEI